MPQMSHRRINTSKNTITDIEQEETEEIEVAAKEILHLYPQVRKNLQILNICWDINCIGKYKESEA